MSGSEVYLGGFSSSNIMRIGIGNFSGVFSSALQGYGIFVTNKRIFGIKDTKRGMHRFLFGTLIRKTDNESKSIPSAPSETPRQPQSDKPPRILKTRLAKGEFSEEFTRMKKWLE